LVTCKPTVEATRLSGNSQKEMDYQTQPWETFRGEMLVSGYIYGII